jgi:hypothetical protein
VSRGAYHPSVARGSFRWSIVHGPSGSGGRLAALAILALWAAGAAVAPVEAAVLHDPEGLLRRPITDVAIVRRSPDDEDPDLLTIDLETPGVIHVRLLRRGDVWSVGDEVNVAVAADEAEQPWLVALADSRFAIVAASDASARTRLIDIRVERSSGRTRIRVGSELVLDNLVTGAGVTDVDGDGQPELVVAGDTWDSFRRCSPTMLSIVSIIDRLSLVRQQEIPFPGSTNLARIARGAFGDWDGHPGNDLLAYASIAGACSVGLTSHIVGVRLRDFGTITDISASLSDPAQSWFGSPLLVDVDGDGRDEAVVGTQSSAAVIDLVEDWQRVDFGARGSVPIDMTTDASGRGVVRWIQPTDGTLRTGRITRRHGDLRVTETDVRSFTDDRTVAEERSVEWSRPESNGLAPVTLRGDLDGDGCDDLIGPRFIASCRGVTPVRTGPAFVASRPLALLGPSTNRRLLVAESESWWPTTCCGFALWPVADGSIGAWRGRAEGSSFHLAEVPTETVEGASATTPRAPAIDDQLPIVGSQVSPRGTILLTAPTGSRVLVRSGAVRVGAATEPRVVQDASAFLGQGRPTGAAGMVIVPVPIGSAPGDTIGTVEFQVDARCAEACPDAQAVDHWVIAAAILDEVGDLGPIVSAVAVGDQISPDVSVDTPLLSPLWPFEATLTGRAEPGASVSIGDRTPVEVDATGTFRLPIQLAPWPQTVEVTAVDAFGNAATASASVMGGIDIRQLPWLAIGTLAVIAGAFVSGVIGQRRSRAPAAVARTVDTDAGPVIEELDEPPLRRHD